MENLASWYSYGALLMVMIFGYILLIACAYASLAFAGFFVYHSAKARAMPNPAAWGVVSAMGGLVAIAAFFVARERTPAFLKCPGCGADVPLELKVCPRCGAQMPELDALPQTAVHKKKSKTHLWLYIISYSALMVGLLLVLCGLFGVVLNTGM